MDRIKLEQIKEEKKEITFRPQINKNSEKIAINKQKSASNIYSTKMNKTSKKLEEKALPTKERKEK